MCGISGILTDLANKELNELSAQMAESLVHRGPDQTNIWTSKNQKLAFAHNRLSIIDLTETGAQPMTSQSGRFTLCFNGEIYNFKKLAALPELTNTKLRGTSDSEVLLELIDAIGFEQALKKTEGMFAIALWDEQEQRLFLARDRMGEKPLYYGEAGNHFLFASELKAFRRYPQFEAKLDEKSLYLFLKYNYVPAPRSIYHGVSKLEAGSFIFGKNPNEILQCEPQYYWDVTQAPQTEKQEWSDADASQAIEGQLLDILKDELISDVPLGAFLSGGIDSSLICALAQKASSSPLNTYTIGFDVKDYDESEHAKKVAKHLGTQHTEWIIDPKETRDLIPEIPLIYDEPFADSSQLPTTLLSRMTKQKVTVALSGDGGDEIFGGYNRHLWLEKIFNFANHFPKLARQSAAGAIHSLPPQTWTKIHSLFKSVPGIQANDFGTKFYKLAQLLQSDSPEVVYDQFLSTWPDPHQALLNKDLTANLRSRPFDLSNQTERLMLFDTQNYLPDDIMVKVDRATMSTSLEARAPFLNHKLFELAWSMPLNLKIRNGESKWILRQILYKHVPKELIERPKQGFGIPITHWFRSDLKEWICDILSHDRIKRQGLFDADCVQRCLKEHLDGRRDNQYQLWSLAVFQSWHDQWMSTET